MKIAAFLAHVLNVFILQFLGDVMTCCKRNDNESALDFILNSPGPIYTSIMLTGKYLDEAQVQKDKSADFINIATFCQVCYRL